MTTKVIVSNRSALSALYGNDISFVDAALNTLIGSDQRRGINTQVVYLDDKVRMQQLKAPPVSNAGSDQENKAAIDGVYNALIPDYLAILGAPDIVPMQRLTNPTPADGDPNVPSDLPYACSGGYSQNISSFLNPTRVVGRIPGINGSKDPTALVVAINTASSMQTRDRALYAAPYLAISAAVWQGSSTTSTSNIFGNAAALQLSPPSGSNWTAKQLGALSHFVNCHGGSNDPQWYGQQGSSYPVAMQATQINGNLPMGVIVAAECCYGGQLYAPGNKTPGICNTYMANRAAAFCGSSTIAYGPPVGQGQADLITQFFLVNLLNGASGGRSMLQARQQFIRQVAPLGGSDLKTIGQFNLMGDPATQAVSAPMQPLAKGMPEASDWEYQSFLRSERRKSLSREGSILPYIAGWLEEDQSAKPTSAVKEQLEKLARDFGLKEWQHSVHKEKGGDIYMKALSGLPHPETFHYLHGQLPDDGKAPFPRFAIVHGREIDGKLSVWGIQYSK